MKKTIKKLMVLFVCIIVALPFALGVISKGYSHTNDYYTISYDGEGDAYVRAKLTINNDLETDIGEVSLEVPGRNVVFYDFLEETKSGKTCIKYKMEPSCVKYDQYYNCERYEDKQVCESWDLTGAHFTRIENVTETPTAESTVINLKLPNAIEKGDAGAITVIYKIPRNAKKSFGAFNFEFKTIMDSKAKIAENVRVAVNVESGYYLKGTDAKVDYRPDFFGGVQAESLSAKMASDTQYYNEFSRQIMSSQGYVKTATNLDPWESFIVKGEYSKSFIRTHAIGSIFGVLAILALSALLIMGVRKMVKNIKQESKKSSLAESAFYVAVTSAAQAIILTLLWGLAWFILSNLNSWIGYQYTGPLGFLIVVLFALLMMAVFFMPPIFIGIKKGIMPAVATFVLCIVWLILLIIVIIILLTMLNIGYGPIVYR